MSRGIDSTFYRLLWITLVAVAFTFTVILTSVFVDIDDLLYKRSPPAMQQQTVTETLRTDVPKMIIDDFQGFPSNEEDTEEYESTFRTKRSVDGPTMGVRVDGSDESNNYLLRIKSPKLKKILTKRLAALLEELDGEEPSKVSKAVDLVDIKDKNNVNRKYLDTEESTIDIKDTKYEKLKNEIDHKDVLHSAIHNIILEGIIRHKDINEIYKKVQLMTKSFDTNTYSDAIDELYKSKFNQSKLTGLMKIIPHSEYNEEDQFFHELIKCKKLQKQILRSQDFRIADKKETAKDLHMVIKTIIEITNNNKGKENSRNASTYTTNDINVLYNGKEIKTEDMGDIKNTETEAVQKPHTNLHNVESFTEKLNTELKNNNESELNKAIADYIKTHTIKFQNKYNLMAKGSFVTKRLKRQIKIRYLNDGNTTEKSKRFKGKPQNNDDELYVEIETHFDGKGTKGEKKKKLVRSLIDKIQKAINSNAEVVGQHKTVQQNHLQIKKRTQNPIERIDLITNTISPIDVIEHRELNPISKTANVIQPLHSVLDKFGDTWKKTYSGPGFLAASKSLNSAEMRELDIDYNSVMKNGIPKRLQKPINTENEDLIKPNDFRNMSNVTLFLKDINGSGFSIGFNQYADEPPDKETLKMFTGLENVIQAYHEHYDQTGTLSDESGEQADYISETNHEIQRRDVNKQRKLNKQSLESYRIIDNKKKRKEKDVAIQNNRYKRSPVNVKLFSNIKSKTKLNKFINTKARATKKIFLKSKRNKRQINKIRIVASDRYPPNTREDIYLVSRENIYADRAIVKEEEVPEVEIEDKNEERYDFIAPYSYDIPNLQPAYLSSTYNTKPLLTGLMSKYPHIFFENISKSTEFINVSPSNTIDDDQKLNAKIVMRAVSDNISNDKKISTRNVDEIVNAILPAQSNLKVVVKILPKNNTNTSPNYKEVHTLINKSYDKNGIRYVSTLNVSEVSKFESLNNTKINNSEVECQQNQMKLLLKLHKERIDQQLEHLKMESQKLKQMIGHENLNITSNLIDAFRQFNLKSQYGSNNSHLNDKNIHVVTDVDTISSKSKTTLSPVFTTVNKQEDPDKLNILSSIKENANITKEILQKIDKNTNTLQLFLQKLLDHRQFTPQVVVKTEKVLSNDTPKYLVNDQLVHPILEQLQTNFTGAIPFIYAFQHPLTENKNKPVKDVANVVYHGHIYANKVVNDEKNNDFSKSVTTNLDVKNINKIHNRENSNETRFFIDELENDFKIVSNLNDHVPVVTSIKTNNTKV